MATGRHALALAENGYAVTAIDFARTALQRLREQARARDLEIDTIQADLEHYPMPANRYQVAVKMFYLQRSLFAPLKAALMPGGVAVRRDVLDRPARDWASEEPELPTRTRRAIRNVCRLRCPRPGRRIVRHRSREGVSVEDCSSEASSMTNPLLSFTSCCDKCATMLRRSVLVIAIALAELIVGCGGGGSSSDGRASGPLLSWSRERRSETNNGVSSAPLDGNEGSVTFLHGFSGLTPSLAASPALGRNTTGLHPDGAADWHRSPLTEAFDGTSTGAQSEAKSSCSARSIPLRPSISTGEIFSSALRTESTDFARPR